MHDDIRDLIADFTALADAATNSGLRGHVIEEMKQLDLLKHSCNAIVATIRRITKAARAEALNGPARTEQLTDPFETPTTVMGEDFYFITSTLRGRHPWLKWQPHPSESVIRYGLTELKEFHVPYDRFVSENNAKQFIFGQFDKDADRRYSIVLFIEKELGL